MGRQPSEELFHLVDREVSNRIADAYDIVFAYPEMMLEEIEHELEEVSNAAD